MHRKSATLLPPLHYRNRLSAKHPRRSNSPSTRCRTTAVLVLAPAVARCTLLIVVAPAQFRQTVIIVCSQGMQT